MNIILQNHQQHSPPRPTRQLRHQGKTYRVHLEDLLTDGDELDTAMAKWCQHRRDDGAAVILLSERGEEHARKEARKMGIESLFSW